MTLEAKTSRVSYIGNGATKTFAFNFKIWKKNQVKVFIGDGVTDSDVSSLVDVSISSSGGSITFNDAPPAGQKVVIKRNMPFTQEDDYRNGARFDGEEVEDRLDQDCAERQDLKTGLSRAIVPPETADKTGAQLWNELEEARQAAIDAAIAAGAAADWLRNFSIDRPEGDISFNYATAYGSSVSRTLADRFFDIVNVKDYGAKGDGLTNDKTAILNAANAAYNSKRHLFFPDGIYLVDSISFPDNIKVLGNVCFKDAGTNGEETYVVRFGKQTSVENIILLMTYNDTWRFGIEVGEGSSINNICVQSVNALFNGEAVHLHGDDVHVGLVYTKGITRGVEIGAYSNIAANGTGKTVDNKTHYNNIFVEKYSLNNCTQGFRVGRASCCTIGSGIVTGLPDSVEWESHTGYNGIYITGSDNIVFGDARFERIFEHAVRIGGDDKISSTNDAQLTHDIAFGCIYASKHGGSALKVSPSTTQVAYNIHVESVISEDAGLRGRSSSRKLSALRISHCDGFFCGRVVSRYSDPDNMPSQDVLNLASTDIVEINNSVHVEINSISANVCGRSVVSFNETNDVVEGTDYSTLSCRDVNIHSISCRSSYPYSDYFYCVQIFTTSMPVNDVKLYNVYIYGLSFYEYVHGSDKSNLSNFFLSVYDRSGVAKKSATETSNIVIHSVASSAGANIISTSKQFDVADPVTTSSLFVENFDNSNENSNLTGNAVVLSRVDAFKEPSGGIAARKETVSRNCGISFLCGTGASGSGLLKDGWILLGESNKVELMPATDSANSTNNLGGAANRISEIFCANATINTSDEREKDNISSLSENLLRAWGKVNFKIFQFKDAIKKKGNGARFHSGVIAQQVLDAFASEGLDARRYGLFCFDEWSDFKETRVVIDKPAVIDSDGSIVEDVVAHSETVVVPAGSRYGIRYNEALALECAYQRWRLEQLEERVNQLTNNTNN